MAINSGLRFYTNIAPVLQTTGGTINSTQTNIPVNSTAGYPANFPYTIAINRGQNDQEFCLVTGVTTTPSPAFLVERGFDGSTAQSHPAQSVVEHSSGGIDFREANAFVNLMSANGDLIYQSGTGPARLGIGQPGQFLGAVNGFPAWLNPVARIGRHYSVSGLIMPPSGASNYLPPFTISFGPGQSATLAKIRTMTRAGTVNFDVRQNGTTVAGLGNIQATTGGNTYLPTTPPTVNEDDRFAPVVLSIGSNPDGLSINFFFDFQF